MKKNKKSIDEYDTVMVVHRECGGWLFWSVDMPSTRKEIKDALYIASKSGQEVRRLPAAFAYSAAPGCQCSLPKVSK